MSKIRINIEYNLDSGCDPDEKIQLIKDLEVFNTPDISNLSVTAERILPIANGTILKCKDRYGGSRTLIRVDDRWVYPDGVPASDPRIGERVEVLFDMDEAD